MGVLRVGGECRGGEEGWLRLLPGAFGQGRSVERGLAVGVSLGEEVRDQVLPACGIGHWLVLVRHFPKLFAVGGASFSRPRRHFLSRSGCPQCRKSPHVVLRIVADRYRALR